MMVVEAHALARHAEEIRRIALRDEVGPEPIPDHQDHDTAAPMMGPGKILRRQRRRAEKNEARETNENQSSEKHPIGHQSGRKPIMSIALIVLLVSDWLSRGGAGMVFEEFPDDIGGVQIVACLAHPFFREPFLSAPPYVADALD